MPITKAAEKALRQNARRRSMNLKRLREIRDLNKKLRQFIAGKKLKEAQGLLPKLYKALDKAAQRDVIKKNAAARKKSRLAKQLKKASLPPK
jgi:small subunit ribosomal protein S20